MIARLTDTAYEAMVENGAPAIPMTRERASVAVGAVMIELGDPKTTKTYNNYSKQARSMARRDAATV